MKDIFLINGQFLEGGALLVLQCAEFHSVISGSSYFRVVVARTRNQYRYSSFDGRRALGIIQDMGVDVSDNSPWRWV